MSNSNTINKERNKARKGAGSESKKDNNKTDAKTKPSSNQTDEVSSSDGESKSKMSSALNTLSKSNTVNKERNKIRKGAGAVSKKNNKKNLQNPSQNQVRQMNFLRWLIYIA